MFYTIINFETNEFMNLPQAQRLNRMREMNPRQVSYFIDDLYIYAQFDTKPDIIELKIVIDIYVMLYKGLYFLIYFSLCDNIY